MVPETDYTFLALEPYNITAPTLSLLINTVSDTIHFKPNCYGVRQSITGHHSRWACVYLSEKMVCFREVFSDTVFYVDAKEKSFKPRIIFDTHGTLVTPEMWGHQLRSRDQVTGILSIYETSRYVFFYYVFADRSKGFNCILFDKTTKTKYKFETGIYLETIANIPGNFEKIRLRDDLSGGPDFTQDVRFLNVHCSGSKMFSLVDAITLKNYVESEDFTNAKVKYPKKKEDLKKLADSLKETDNPVLIVVTPKE